MRIRLADGRGRVSEAKRPFAQPLHRLLANAGLGRVDQADEVHAAFQIVEDDHVLGHHQHDVRRSERVGRRAVAQPLFHVTDAVVAEIPDQAAVEAGQARQGRHPVASLEFFDECQWIVCLKVFADRAVHRDGNPLTGYRQHRPAGQADDGIASPALAALGGFQQIGKRPPGEFQVGGQRRFEIGQGFDDNRNAVVSCGGQPGKILFGVHGFVSCGKGGRVAHGGDRKRGACRPALRGSASSQVKFANGTLCCAACSLQELAHVPKQALAAHGFGGKWTAPGFAPDCRPGPMVPKTGRSLNEDRRRSNGPGDRRRRSEDAGGVSGE